MDRSHVENILSKRLEDYMNEASADLRLEESNIKEKAMLRSSFGAKWCRYRYEEQKYLKLLEKNLDDLKEEVKKKLYEKQKIAMSEADANMQRMINIKAEQVIVKSIEYKNIKEKIDQQEDILRLIEETQHLISQFGYDIKNALEVLKLENMI